MTLKICYTVIKYTAYHPLDVLQQFFCKALEFWFIWTGTMDDKFYTIGETDKPERYIKTTQARRQFTDSLAVGDKTIFLQLQRAGCNFIEGRKIHEK